MYFSSARLSDKLSKAMPPYLRPSNCSPIATVKAGRPAEWRLFFKAVYAKAGLDESTGARYRDDLYELFADNLYDADDNQQDNPDAISFDIDDEDAPHWPLDHTIHPKLC